MIDNPHDYVSGAIYRGACARWGARKKLADNPYAASPGYCVLNRAWDFGFRNAEAVLQQHDEPDVPPDERMPVDLPPLR